ncbi:molecular chaperone [Thermodesulfovibrio sp. Kuro-1]|uniref:TorD/DmsD family molecular chaperone n=1 Tax=Thermodesulfovibrio sp. Kuro-1 TaxID=2580394 RepID=UPI0011420E51|nr:molecular chaperone TorD family protein [Thermodesulfovibrio sp. Kuro-1]
MKGEGWGISPSLFIMEIKNEIRQFFYSFFSEILDYPKIELIIKLFSNEFSKNITFLKEFFKNEKINSKISTNIYKFLKHIRGINKASYSEVYLLELQKEYTRLCHVSKPRLLPLFESVYKEGKLFQDSTIKVVQLYRQAGLEVINNFSLPPDHISLELEFMAYLCSQETEALAKNEFNIIEKLQKLQLQMFHDHLYPFATEFAARLQKYSVIDFYKLVAELLEDFMILEKDCYFLKLQAEFIIDKN